MHDGRRACARRERQVILNADEGALMAPSVGTMHTTSKVKPNKCKLKRNKKNRSEAN